MGERRAYVSGYVHDVAFRSGVVAGQMPAAMNFVALTNGFLPPVRTARLRETPFRYLDLGCGEGTTLLALATLYPQARFFGIDFNPDHIGAGREAAARLGLDNLTFIEGSFAELERFDLGDFEYIACNGIYGWLAPKLQEAIDRFVGSHLKEGGIFYVEYLTLPGKVSVAALWRFVQKMVPEERYGSGRARAEAALAFLEKLARRGVAFLNRNPEAAAALQHYLTAKRRDPYMVDHFAHNALAAHYHPRYFDEIDDRFSAQGLSFAGRADLPLNDLSLSLPPMQVPLVEEIEETRVRELLKDFIRNEGDRRDLWIKRSEAERDPEAARLQLSEDFWLAPRVPKERLVRQLQTPGGGTVGLVTPSYETLIEAAYRGPVRLADLEAFAKAPERYRRAFFHLAASGQFFLIVDPKAFRWEVPEALLRRIAVTPPFNDWQLDRNASRRAGSQMIARATGGVALVLSPLETLLLAAWRETPADRLPETVHGRLQRDEAGWLFLEGKGFLPCREVERGEIERLWREFLEKKLPNLNRLAIIEER